jgi:molecular chaperone DnaJ
MASQDWFEKDFYAVLGVSKDVSDSELKKVYRKLARQFHPDSNPGDKKAEARFKEISEAYTVLSDSATRQEYDQIRAMGGGARFTSGGPGGQGGFEDMFGNLFGGGGGQRVRFQPGAEDLFGGLFGGGGNPFGGQPRGGSNPRKGADLTAAITIDFRTAMNGGEVSLDTKGSKPLHIAIPAGVADKQKIRVRGKGEASMTGGPAGDLVLTVSVTEHPVFSRDGNNIRVDVPVTIPEAILGATIEVPTLDGERVKVKVPANTPSGRVLRVRDRGISLKGKKGDLLATILIVTPDTLSDQAKSLIEKFDAETTGGNPRDALYGKAES